MIKINNKISKKYKTKIIWNNFSAVVNGKKEIGLAPIIKFFIDNKIIIELELVFSKEKFQELEINKKINISRYLVGVSYEDDKGWLPILNDSTSIYFTRINQTEFNIDFEINSIELDDIKININTCLKIL